MWFGCTTDPPFPVRLRDNQNFAGFDYANRPRTVDNRRRRCVPPERRAGIDDSELVPGEQSGGVCIRVLKGTESPSSGSSRGGDLLRFGAPLVAIFPRAPDRRGARPRKLRWMLPRIVTRSRHGHCVTCVLPNQRRHKSLLFPVTAVCVYQRPLQGHPVHRRRRRCRLHRIRGRDGGARDAPRRTLKDRRDNRGLAGFGPRSSLVQHLRELFPGCGVHWNKQSCSTGQTWHWEGDSILISGRPSSRTLGDGTPPGGGAEGRANRSIFRPGHR